jgi:hypothetical protein
MLCPRGDHGTLNAETYPTSYYCLICGHREYPGFVKRTGEPVDKGPRPHISAKRKKQMGDIIHSLTERGYNIPEIMELTGYSRGLVAKQYCASRKLLKEE